MKEQVLKEYFDGTISADKLSDDLIGTVEVKGAIANYNIINYKSDADFVVTSKHLIKLCKDVLDKRIKLADLRAIAFSLRCSDFFTWDSDTTDGGRVDEIIFNWESPEINTPTTKEYIMVCATYLETGKNKV